MIALKEWNLVIDMMIQEMVEKGLLPEEFLPLKERTIVNEINEEKK
jgi:hypothetical protein